MNSSGSEICGVFHIKFHYFYGNTPKKAHWYCRKTYFKISFLVFIKHLLRLTDEGLYYGLTSYIQKSSVPCLSTTTVSSTEASYFSSF